MADRQRGSGGTKKYGRDTERRSLKRVRYNAKAKARGWNGQHRRHRKIGPLEAYRRDHDWAKA